MIQTHVRDARTNALIEIGPNDPRYWQGPYVYIPYPKALYRITALDQKVEQAEEKIVGSEREHNAMGSAWKESRTDAKAHFDNLQAEVARAAAEANYADRNMGEQAKAEKLAVERASEFTHVTDVPAPKKRTRGPNKKKSLVSAE